MLARTPKATTAQPHYSEKLKIPPRPASLAEAEAALTKAATERQSAQAIHVAALQQFRAMVPGQPPTISAREVDEVGAELREKFEAEQLAQIHRDAEKAEYESSLHAQIAEGLDGLKDELLEIANHLERVLAYGTALHASAAAARINLRDILPARCRDMSSQLVRTIRHNAQ